MFINLRGGRLRYIFVSRQLSVLICISSTDSIATGIASDTRRPMAFCHSIGNRLQKVTFFPTFPSTSPFLLSSHLLNVTAATLSRLPTPHPHLHPRHPPSLTASRPNGPALPFSQLSAIPASLLPLPDDQSLHEALCCLRVRWHAPTPPRNTSIFIDW